MKKRTLFALFFATIITSCDDRLEQFQIVNQAPKVEFIKDENIIADLQDSLRLIPGVKNVYNIHLKVDDANIQLLNWEITKGNYKLYYQSNEAVLPNSFQTDYGDVILNVYPEGAGNYGAQFKATDKLGLQATGKFNLFVFDNLLPIAKLKATISSSGSQKYVIVDASESYDADRNFKGGIVEYQFTIDDRIIRLKNPILHHIFKAGSGKHLIELKVLDNSDGISESVNTTVTIN